jgi:hypothetical protein
MLGSLKAAGAYRTELTASVERTADADQDGA